MHVDGFVEVFTFESWLLRTIRLLVQYFFDIGLKLVNFSTYGNLVAEENISSSEWLVIDDVVVMTLTCTFECTPLKYLIFSTVMATDVQTCSCPRDVMASVLPYFSLILCI